MYPESQTVGRVILGASVAVFMFHVSCPRSAGSSVIGDRRRAHQPQFNSASYSTMASTSIEIATEEADGSEEHVVEGAAGGFVVVVVGGVHFHRRRCARGGRRTREDHGHGRV